jgi:predicted aspartyl protease
VRVQGHDIEMLVDTGAAYTALSNGLVTLFSLPREPQRTQIIAPAHGPLHTVPVITLPDVRLGGFRLLGVEALLLAFPSALRVEGILGMNILRQFRVTLESDTGTLVVRPLRGPPT